MTGEFDEIMYVTRERVDEMLIVSEELETRVRELTSTILHAPFTKRTWSELCSLLLGAVLAGVGFVVIGFSMAAGVAFAITFFGLAVLGLSIRVARKVGTLQRGIARTFLEEQIEEPEPFAPRPGFLGWLQGALRDRTGWRAVAYVAAKVPLAFLGVFAAFSVWFDALTCLITPLGGGYLPKEFGLVPALFQPGYFSIGAPGWLHGVAVFFTGAVLLFLAPWPVRVVVHADKLLMRALLGPDPVATRMRSLADSRAQTVDASAATLRRIERDLHDGTQAQLVALAMRLGMAKEKLADADNVDINRVRELVDDAHRGAKDAIVELRDLARGIHPPALDIGLEGALSTLAARSTVPTELTISLNVRPTPAIEAIAYFCVAELLANVAQHAKASRAEITCAQHGMWLRLVVRDDGIGGAQLSTVGSSSSGLAGLADRLHAVDGGFDIVSPPGGPTVVTVDLPLHA
ncbi:MAG: sensor histidine kinase [Acidimicrobiales bacterium]